MNNFRKGQILFVVEDTFDVTGRGLVVSGLYTQAVGGLKHEEKVLLKRPDGSALETTAYFVFTNPSSKSVLSLSLPGLSKEQVPLGTEVWSSRSAE